MIGLGLLLIVVGILAAIFWVPHAGALVFVGVVLVIVGAVLDIPWRRFSRPPR